MIKLYQLSNSVCCQKVRIVLCEKSLNWESIEVNLFRAEQFRPDYLKLNPKGVVPTVVHEGQPIIESTLICEYLDDTFPEPPLTPTDPLLRTRMRIWSKAVDEGLHDGITDISFSAMFRERMKKMPEELREARFRNVGDPRRRDRFMSTYELGAQSPFVMHGAAAYEKSFKMLEDTLNAGGPWILGDQPSLADINLMPYVARLDYLGLLNIWTEERRHVLSWWEMVQAWPSFIKGLSAAVTSAEAEEMGTYGPKIRNELEKHLVELRHSY